MKIIDVIDYFQPKLGYQKTSLIKEQMLLEHELYGYCSAADCRLASLSYYYYLGIHVSWFTHNCGERTTATERASIDNCLVV